METALWIALGYGLALVGKIIAMFWIDHRRSVEFERRHRSRHNQRREAQSMTHEPDIIREAERVVRGGVARNHTIFLGGNNPEAVLFPDGTMVLNDAARNSPYRNPLYGLDNPEPTVRFTYDGTQSDPGDEHTPR